MRVLLISHSDGGGGAGRAAYRLLKALEADGVDATMAVDYVNQSDPRVIPLSGTPARRMRVVGEQLADKILQPTDPHNFSAGVTGGVSPALIKRLRPEVINYHWTGFGTASIAQMGSAQVPSVWTLHDMWALGDGEHYFTQMPEKPRSRAERWVHRQKQRFWTTPRVLVTPSRWLRDEVHKSAFLRGWPVRVIPNPVDLEVFSPQDQAKSRAEIGLARDAQVVLFALTNELSDRRKGWDLLVQALDHLKRTQGESAHSIELVILGHGAPPSGWMDQGFTTHWLGRTFNNRDVARAYAVSDVVVVPSRRDNLPQVATEAAACGRAVVAFRTGGLPDIIDQETTGFLAAPNDAAELARGIAWVLANESRKDTLGAAARRKAELLYRPATIASAYIDAFDQAISMHHASGWNA